MLRRWIRSIVPERFRWHVIRKVAGASLEKKDSTIESLQERALAAEKSHAEVARDLAVSAHEIERLRRADAEREARFDATLKEQADAWAASLKEAVASATQETSTREAATRSRIRRAVTLLRMNSPQATQGALELLDKAPDTSSDESAFLFDVDADTRSQRLLALSQTELNTGRWTALLRTERAAERLSGPASSDGYLLVNDTRTQNNIGCRATTSSLVRELASHGLQVVSSITLAELVEMSNQIRAHAGAPPNEENFDLYADLIQSSEIFAACREIAHNTRGVIVNGEGSIYDKQPKGLMLLALANVLSERMHKPVAMVNYSVDLKNPIMEAWARKGLQCLKWSAFREPVSAARLPQDFPSLRGPGWFPDAAFLVDPAPTDDGSAADCEIALGSDSIIDTQIERPYVILSGSSSLYRRDRAVTDVRDAFAQLCLALSDQGLNPVLWEADKQDRLLLRATALELQLPYMSASVPLRTAQEVVRGAVCIVSGRWHASILAARWGCPPILGDANFFKTGALHEMLGIEEPMFEYRELGQSLGAMASSIARLANERDTYRSTTMERAEQLAQQAHAGIAETARVLLDGSQ